ncbi:hypothetical protein [Spiroplasma poulsonii]|uniref:hypothetical protein n=1 Tax=Spiroplasma poulsonii TaxID=2138 RepID=UPI000589FA83|nr:hypothetical protein [Spiroplasma poulsonii]
MLVTASRLYVTFTEPKYNPLSFVQTIASLYEIKAKESGKLFNKGFNWYILGRNSCRLIVPKSVLVIIEFKPIVFGVKVTTISPSYCENFGAIIASEWL